MVQREETLKVKEIIEFYQNLLKEAAKSSLRIIFDIPPAFKPIKNMRIENMTTCGIFNILGILGDGTISICGIGSNVNTLRLGRIKIDPIKDIWENHPVLKEIRENIPNQLTGICGRCMLKCYCLGKCRAEAYYTNGSLNAPLSFCQTAYEEGFFPGSRIIDK
jgi:radical SAM protein with 4Fe4S-binding SPASM domain